MNGKAKRSNKFRYKKISVSIVAHRITRMKTRDAEEKGPFLTVIVAAVKI